MGDTSPSITLECLGGPLDGDRLYCTPWVSADLEHKGHLYFRGTVELPNGYFQPCWIYAGIADDPTPET